jgi:flagellar biosynthesis GTPase FlhF
MDHNQQRNQEQDELENKFIVIPMKVMADERLTLADKNVYGRAFFFSEFFESPERTAKILGISANQVKISRRKLEELGLIRCISNDGRGKRYVVTTAWQQRRVSESDPQTVRFLSPDNQNLTPENKAESKAEDKEESLKDKSFKEAPEAPASEPLKEEPEQPARYGKAEINELLDLWQEQTGFSHHGTKAERYAINNLLRKNGYEATKALIRRVGTARRSDDQFAPQIAKPSQLQGKYSKLEALTMWEERQHKQTEDTNHPDFNLLYPVAHLDDYDYRGDKTKEELHADAQSIRDKWAGTKYERIFKRRSADEEDA